MMLNEEPSRKKVNKAARRSGKRRIINQDIFKISIFFTVLFFSMMLFLGYFLAFRSTAVINNTYNRRSDDLKQLVVRGSILDREGEVLAYTQTGDDGQEKRVYPYGNSFAHVVGFESNGGLGLESSYNFYMLSSSISLLDQLKNEFSSTKSPGDCIVTTLDRSLQERLYQILGGNSGAIVVLDPSTGEIIGMVSEPGFDPNTITEEWEAITSDEENSVLLNRAAQATLTPGSTFKVFTLLEYYRQNSGMVGGYTYDCTGQFTASDNTIGCVGGTAHGTEDLKSSFANSCNCSFANIGLTLDLERFAKDNAALLFNGPLPLDIAYKPSSFTLNSMSTPFMVMQTTFGQGETLVSPVHLAMIASAAANDGLLMQPHLVSEVRNTYGKTVRTFAPSEYGRLMTQDEAAFLKEYMRAVVTDGTAIELSYDGNYISYGKTGTAETYSDKNEHHDHSWFMGFAEHDGRTIALCTMIEDAQEAGMTGVHMAKQVFDYYFN